jgi:hypothetical protein
LFQQDWEICIPLDNNDRKVKNSEDDDVTVLPVIYSRSVAQYGGRAEVYTGLWWGILRERNLLEDPGVDGRIILRWISRKWDVRAWTVSMWLRIGTGGEHL